jgi:DNA-binding MarR family transcriptional regulator
VSRVGDARRLQQAIVDLGRITTSRRLGASRAERARVVIAPAAASVLRHVVLDGPIRPVALSERTRMKPSALSRQLKSLEGDGLIERVSTPDDGRGAVLRPTRRGRSMQRRLEQADDEILAEQLAGWSATELSTLADLLERFIVDLRTPPADRRSSASATAASAATSPATTATTTRRPTTRRTR